MERKQQLQAVSIGHVVHHVIACHSAEFCVREWWLFSAQRSAEDALLSMEAVSINEGDL